MRFVVVGASARLQMLRRGDSAMPAAKDPTPKAGGAMETDMTESNLVYHGLDLCRNALPRNIGAISVGTYDRRPALSPGFAFNCQQLSVFFIATCRSHALSRSSGQPFRWL
jgi:hypothetical protein